MPAIKLALPTFNKSVHAMSFRVPTAIVSASDMTLTLDRDIDETELIHHFTNLAKKYPNVRWN